MLKASKSHSDNPVSCKAHDVESYKQQPDEDVSSTKHHVEVCKAHDVESYKVEFHHDVESCKVRYHCTPAS